MKNIFTILVSAFAMYFSTIGLTNAQGINPYLQSVTTQSIVVNWKTDYTTPATVKLGTDSTSLSQIVTGTTQTMSDVGYTNNYHYHTIKLNGLTPNTRYYYRAVTSNDSSKIHSFRTLPSIGTLPNASGKLRMLVLGDNQIKSQPRYDSLMMAAKRKAEELYGPNFNDSISFILNMGDQVDVGTLDHYEHVHLNKSKYLSGELPIFPAVGNHETYGTLQMQAYYNHFVLDSMQYKGIYSGNENYYSFQAGNTVIVYLNTEAGNATQFNWFKQVIDSANVDNNVKWIITIGHRPYQAEQYVGDISTWVRNTVVPYAMNSPKFVLHFGAHHHIYARGQMKNAAAYNIISGGTAWNQYWNMATEENFDDVQKTISQWAYQLVEVDMINDKIDVTSYSIGSIYNTKNNDVIDSFHRYLNLANPSQPSITNNFADSLMLPLTITASAFQSTSAQLLNSTEFQVAADRNFTIIEKNSYRHYEDLFGRATGADPDSTKDVNANVNINEYTLPLGSLTNGWFYTRVRHRDRNLNWSNWSTTDSFKVYNSVYVNPALSMDTNRFTTGTPVTVFFTNGPTHPSSWIGIYKRGQTPGTWQGTSTASAWAYTNATNGSKNFNLSAADEYFAAYFADGGYTEVAPRVKFYYGPNVTLNTSQPNYNVGDTIPVTFANAPSLTNDWIGVYKIGMVPGGPASVKWSYVSGANGTYNVTGLAKGYYFASYFLRDQYFEASDRVYFSVGDTITTLYTDDVQYNLGEYIAASWIDGPGNPKDWLGIYPSGSNPNTDTFVSYTYIDGQPSGALNIPDSAMPQITGNYFIVLFTNDSYDEVSNRVYFEMLNNTPLPINLLSFSGAPQGFDHLIQWHASGENENDKYHLQWSKDGNLFTTINTQSYAPYQKGKYDYLNEQTESGNNFYRLMMTDVEGKSHYSKTILIHRDENGENTVNLYPNPLTSGNKSIIESPYPIDQIDVLDVNGRTIYKSKNINNHKFSLLHQELPAGTYFIKIYSRKLYTMKLVVN